jgi:hypothetical protein
MISPDFTPEEERAIDDALEALDKAAPDVLIVLLLAKPGVVEGMGLRACDVRSNGRIDVAHTLIVHAGEAIKLLREPPQTEGKTPS